VSKANKRERQKENRERARIERERLQRRDRRMRTLRSLAFVLVPVIAILVVITLVSGNDDDSKAATGPCAGSAPKPATRTFATAPPMTIDPAKKYTADVCTSEGDITIALDPKAAPIATNNFVFLATSNFYNGLDFHRAAKDFVIQGGDPKGDGSGGPGYTVVGEVPTDHYPVGSLAAAKSGSEPAGTFGSQFFIVTGPNGKTLPNDYARWGSVTKGLSVAQKIEGFAPSSGDGTPTQKVTIDKIVISVDGKVQGVAPTTSTTAAATSSTTAAATSSTTG